MNKLKNFAIVFMAITTISVGCSTGTAKTEKSATSSKQTVQLTNDTFKEKVFDYEVNKEWKFEGDIPCIVDFYADWCGPCKQIAPVLEELAEEYEGKIIIYKVDTEKQRELASAFGIRSIPSLLFIPVNGQPQMSQGALPKEQFKKIIDEFLLKKGE